MSLIFLILIGFSSASFFKQEPNIIQYGKNLNLICIAPNTTNFITEYKKSPYWFVNNKKITVNNVYDKKYGIYKIYNKFILKIINFTNDDLTFIYKCKYKKNRFKYLPSMLKNFEKPLLETNISVTLKNISKNVMDININFPKIFPSPYFCDCYIIHAKSRAYNVKMKYLYNNYKIDDLYVNSTITIKLTAKIYCDDILNIKCSILKNYYFIKNKYVKKCEPEFKPKNIIIKKLKTGQNYLIISLVCICILSIMCMGCWLKKK